ncbi:hypothetical protein BGZ61DRAFT_442582 [Ilyonectria robusta]|uniref:uncharacterized protein n=1 Tax=Ilyonectria robusta TaxID=1079257 RepID=UPI001E8D7CBA|nr:uncharacterized protein BGZ61DRAFT_442582 [Ilyonectria robusta]KAH8734460.1 hypothetical protein BGZ61DRAFT_442582 [Ilyonectria robusta]
MAIRATASRSLIALRQLNTLRGQASVVSRALPATLRMNSSAAAALAPSPAKTTNGFSAVQTVSNFEETIAKRPDFDHSNPPIEVTKSPDSTWSFGHGVRNKSPSATDPRQKVHKEIDPYSSDRSVSQNYRLLVSGIAPRPVGFISTLSVDGKTKNLAPFSYFQLVDHDPPMFIVSFSSRFGAIKDTYQNLKDTGECVINTVSENMIEAVSASSIDAPYGLSEWDVTGLHEAPTTTVKPSRVQESVFSIEGKVVDIKEFAPHQPGMSSAAIVLLEATRFWVQEDAANEDFSHIDLEKLRPIAQLGGMSYGRITSTFELPRMRWVDEQPKSDLLTKLEEKSKQ